MRRIIIPLVFIGLMALAGTLSTVIPASADTSAKPAYSGGDCPFKDA
jgi:hypothetical protein